MLDKQQREHIFCRTLERSAPELMLASESYQKGLEPKTQLSRIRRSLRAVKTDARTVKAGTLERLAGHLERAAESAHVHGDPEFPVLLLEDFIRLVRARAQDPSVAVDPKLMAAARRVGNRARARLREGGVRPA
jgi:hypothetical protein